MSVSSSTSRIQYVGNNDTGIAYPVPWRFTANADIVVVETDSAGVDTTLILSTDYTLIGVGDASGGSLTTTVAVPSLSFITITLEVEIIQPAVYVENADFPASTQEGAFDKLTWIAQGIDRATKASIRVSDVEGERDLLVPVATTILGLDGDKMPTTYTVDELKSFLALTGVTLDVDAGMKTFADSSERDLAVPDFTGQLGTQRDTQVVYISSGTSAGNWALFSTVLAMFAADEFTADAAGRLPFTDGIWNAAKLATDAVETAKILDANVTAAKLAATLDLSSKTLTMPSGHWAAIAPSRAVIQSVYAEDGTHETWASGTFAEIIIPNDDTTPTAAEGKELLTASITAASASNTLRITMNTGSVLSSTNSSLVLMAARDSGAAEATIYDYCNNNGAISQMLQYEVSAGTVSAQTIRMRLGRIGAGSIYINGTASDRRFFGTLKHKILVEEIKA